MGVLFAEPEIQEAELEVIEPDTGVRPFRWTVKQFERLAAEGLLDDRRVELVNGEIINMPAMAVPHAVALSNVNAKLFPIIPAHLWLRQQSPLVVSTGSQLEPDFAIVERPSGTSLLEHPSTAQLVIEISDTTLNYDRRTKSPLYAAANIPEYWILNLNRRQLEVRRGPMEDANTTSGFAYRTVTTYGENDSVSPLFALDQPLTVSDLLP